MIHLAYLLAIACIAGATYNVIVTHDDCRHYQNMDVLSPEFRRSIPCYLDADQRRGSLAIAWGLLVAMVLVWTVVAVGLVL